MVGHHIPHEQLDLIVKRTMKEADEDKDNFLNFDEFKKVQRYAVVKKLT